MGVVWEWRSHYWGSLEFPLSTGLKHIQPTFATRNRPIAAIAHLATWATGNK